MLLNPHENTFYMHKKDTKKKNSKIKDLDIDNYY